MGLIDSILAHAHGASPDIVNAILSAGPSPTSVPDTPSVPSATPPPPSYVRPLKTIVRGGREPNYRPVPTVAVPQTPRPPQIPPGVAWTRPVGPSAETNALARVVNDLNPSAESVREKLGFSWGKGVDVDPATGRPRTRGTFRLTAPDFTPGSPTRTGGVVRETPEGGPGGYEMAPEDSQAAVARAIQELSAQRQLERLQVGRGAAPATAGEQLQDKRSTAKQAGLQAELENDISLLDRDFASGRITREKRDAEEARMRREFHAAMGEDPRFYSMP